MPNGSKKGSKKGRKHARSSSALENDEAQECLNGREERVSSRPQGRSRSLGPHTALGVEPMVSGKKRGKRSAALPRWEGSPIGGSSGGSGGSGSDTGSGAESGDGRDQWLKGELASVQRCSTDGRRSAAMGGGGHGGARLLKGLAIQAWLHPQVRQWGL
jgi:hypothetical protein